LPEVNRNDQSEIKSPDLGLIRERAALLRELRAFFDARGFFEVQPPCLSRNCIVDAFIDPIEVPATQLRLGMDLPDRLYLQTSPELAMKRMLAAGSPSIYSIGPVFRAGESGTHHNTEFTMLEWYEVGADLHAGVQLLGTLAAEVLQRDSFDVVTYRKLFQDHLGFDPITADVESLLGQARRADASLADSIGSDRDALLDVILSEFVQPHLGWERPLIVTNYPLSQAALARQSSDDASCAARFELFASGIEIANGYDELRDQEILSARFRENAERRKRSGRPNVADQTLSLQQRISADLPACAGVALGVDRLLMVRTGKQRIREVLPFPIDLA